MEGYAALRGSFLDVGRNLVRKGALDKAEDIFFLRTVSL
jgi:hypothetical protein